jgi:hypothetical protein
MTRVELGSYCIVTRGYGENGGMVSKSKEALLFLQENEGFYRKASKSEIKKYLKRHPILRE